MPRQPDKMNWRQYLDLNKEPLTNLFEKRDAMTAEIQDRAWRYLLALGYQWYSQTTMNVSLLRRGEVTLVSVMAEFQHNHEQKEVMLEIPLPHFELIVPEKGNALAAKLAGEGYVEA